MSERAWTARTTCSGNWSPFLVRRRKEPVELFGEEVVEGQDFRMPHRGISRTYNLAGLADLGPSIRILGLGPVTDLLAGADLGGGWEYEGGEQAVSTRLRN